MRFGVILLACLPAAPGCDGGDGPAGPAPDYSLSLVIEPGAGSVTTVVAALAASCALNAAGLPYCSGVNGGGYLGAPSTETCFESTPCNTRPVAVSGGFTFTTLSGWWTNRCGLIAGGEAYCWGGRNEVGQLGDGTITHRTVPTPVAGALRFASISAGQGHTCGVTTSGEAYCWGDNSDLVPTPVAGGHRFTAVHIGEVHTCGVSTSGTALCWGDNRWGQLGDGTATARHVPTPVAGGHAFAAVSTGGSSSVGARTAA